MCVSIVWNNIQLNEKIGLFVHFNEAKYYYLTHRQAQKKVLAYSNNNHYLDFTYISLSANIGLIVDFATMLSGGSLVRKSNVNQL